MISLLSNIPHKNTPSILLPRVYQKSPSQIIAQSPSNNRSGTMIQGENSVDIGSKNASPRNRNPRPILMELLEEDEMKEDEMMASRQARKKNVLPEKKQPNLQKGVLHSVSDLMNTFYFSPLNRKQFVPFGERGIDQLSTRVGNSKQGPATLPSTTKNINSMEHLPRNGSLINDIHSLLHHNSVQRELYLAKVRGKVKKSYQQVLQQEKTLVERGKNMPLVKSNPSYNLMFEGAINSQLNENTRKLGGLDMKLLKVLSQSTAKNNGYIDPNTRLKEHNSKVFWYNFDHVGWRPEDREGGSFSFVTGKGVYLYGGIASYSLDDLCLLEPGKMIWSQQEQNGQRPICGRVGHTANAVGKMIVFLGGEKKFNHEICIRENFPDVRTFNTERQEWKVMKTTGDMYEPRRNHTATTVGRSIVIHAGVGVKGTCISDFIALNVVTWKFWNLNNNVVRVDTSKSTTTTEDMATSGSLTSKKTNHPLFMGVSNFGGCFVKRPGTKVLSLEQFVHEDENKKDDKVENQPGEKEKNGAGREDKTNSLTKDESAEKAGLKLIEGIYYFGGIGDKGVVIDALRVLKLGKGNTYEFSLLETIGEGPCARFGHSMDFFEQLSLIIIYGGRNDKCQPCYLDDLHILEPTLLMWSKIEIFGANMLTAKPPRAGHSTAIVDSKLIIFGGLNLDGFVGADVAVLELDPVRAEKLRIMDARGELLPMQTVVMRTEFPEHKIQKMMEKIGNKNNGILPKLPKVMTTKETRKAKAKAMKKGPMEELESSESEDEPEISAATQPAEVQSTTRRSHHKHVPTPHDLNSLNYHSYTNRAPATDGNFNQGDNT